MAYLGESIGVDDLPQSDRNYDLIPDGWYSVKVTKADLAQTKSGNGTKIDMRYDITGPTHEGRVVFGSINIRNQSQRAEEIGRQQLGDLMRALGIAKLEDTDQLIGGNVSIKIGRSKPQEGYEVRNEVKGYKSLSGSTPPVSAAPAAATAPAGGKPPWAK